MFGNLFINPICWAIAVIASLAWARFCTFIAQDVTNLRKQPELLWKILPLGVFFLTLWFWVLLPSFWIGLVINVLLMAMVVAWYWMVRVQEMGKKGHLFYSVISGIQGASKSHEDRKAAKSVMLTYLNSNDSPVPLPRPDDPMHAGMAYADQMLVTAVEQRAQDVEMSPGSAGYDLRMMVDGVGYPQPAMPRNLAEPLIQAIKQLAGLSLEERRRPQEGAFKVRDVSGNITRWTARTSGTTAGEKLTLSANEKGRWNIPLDQLGFNTEQLAAVKALGNDTTGVVIVATPRANGRTTTLYSLLGIHDAFTNSVHTLETNPQADVEGVTVHRFDPRNTESSYAKTLQSIFLKDPTVALTAQVPDAATAEAIARFGADEHRVYVGMPAFDTMAALEIWLKLVSDRKLAVKSLRAIISERLLRILCPTCKSPYQPDEATLRRMNLPVGRNLQSFKANTEGVVDEKGRRSQCPDCLSVGYRGRTGIFEVLILTDAMRKEILDGATIKQVQASARKNNMTLLAETGIRKFASGLTTISEVQRVLTPAKGDNPSAASGVRPSQA